MGKTWVLPSFKHILIDFSEEYLNKTDKGKDKARSALVTTVAHDIRDAVKDTGDSLPDDLEKVGISPYHYCKTPTNVPSLSEHGFKMRLPDMPKGMEERVPRTIHVAIQRQRGLGLQKQFAERSITTRLQRYKHAYQEEARRIYLNTTPPCRKCLQHFPTMRKVIVRRWPMNGIALSLQSTFSESKCSSVCPNIILLIPS